MNATSLRRMSALLFAMLVPATLAAAQPPVPGPVISKYDRANSNGDVAGQSITPQAPPTLYWYDGDRRRLLVPAREAATASSDPAVSARSATLSATAAAGGKDATMAAIRAAGKSATFIDADGSGKARSLPGGVVVTVANPTTQSDLDDLLSEFGTRVLRPVGAGGRVWLIESGAGLDALTLANTIHESRKVLSASPNWATARKTK
ncbi:MAG: hypothetical protein R3E68_01175 [Burkholderiaceae bacterium]